MALAAPLALGLFPSVRLPAIVLEIVLGIVIGPQVLGWFNPASDTLASVRYLGDSPTGRGPSRFDQAPREFVDGR